jgi:hypothetical protein
MAEATQPETSAAVSTVAPFKPYAAEDPNANAKRLLPIVLGIENMALREFLIACETSRQAQIANALCG